MAYKYTVTALFNLTQEAAFKRFLQKEYCENSPYQEIISWPENQSELNEGDSYQVKTIFKNRYYTTNATILQIENLDRITCRTNNNIYTSFSTIDFIKDGDGTKVICEQKIQLHGFFTKLLLPVIGIKPEGKESIKRVYEKINNNQELIISHHETLMGMNKRLFSILSGFIIGIMVYSYY